MNNADIAPNPNLFEGKFKDAFVQVNRLRLHYTEWGAPTAKPLLLLHGLNVQLHTWDPIAARLSERFRVFCMDLRGHGDSDWTREGYQVQAFVSDVDEFVRELKIIPFGLVGHSLGARIGIAYAGEHPESLTHLLLSDTGPEISKSAAIETAKFIENTNDTRGFRSEQEAFDHYRKAHPEWQPIFLHLHARYQVRLNWAGKYVMKADPDLYWIMRGAGLKEVPYLWEMAKRANVPTLIMTGARSNFFDRELLERLQRTLPRADVATLNTGHYIPREDPDGFCRTVSSFLDRA